MARLKSGVIGCGGHGRGHIGRYAELPDAELVAVTDANPERAREAASEFKVPHHYTDYREMFARHALDVVSLALPPAANRDAALTAFEAGAHVLVSKPMAINLAQAREMVAAAGRSGKRISLSLQNRFHPEVQALRRFLADGRLGRVYHARLWHGHVMDIPGTPTMYRRSLAGGGVLFHTMVHLLDAVIWTLGNPRPVRASAASYQKLRRMKKPVVTWKGSAEDCDIEDFNVGLVHFADGSTMTLESNWLMHPRMRPSGAELLGDWGVAGLRPLRVELEDGDQIVDVTSDIPLANPDDLGNACRDLCRSVLEGRPPSSAPMRSSTSSGSWTPSIGRRRRGVRSASRTKNT
jgi:predicted dehydrogenase